MVVSKVLIKINRKNLHFYLLYQNKIYFCPAFIVKGGNAPQLGQNKKTKKQKLKNMTLTEYLNQENPVWNPNVILKNDEVIVLTTIKVAGEKRSLVKVNSEDSLLKDIHYCLVNHRLYVMDYDGNPRKPSVFRLEY